MDHATQLLTPLIIWSLWIRHILDFVSIDLCIKATTLVQMDGEGSDTGVDGAPCGNRLDGVELVHDIIQFTSSICLNLHTLWSIFQRNQSKW